MTTLSTKTPPVLAPLPLLSSSASSLLPTSEYKSMIRSVESIEVLSRKSLKQSNTVLSRKVPNKTIIIGRMANFDQNDHTTSVLSSVSIEILSDGWKRDYLDARRKKLLSPPSSSSSTSPDYQKGESTASSSGLSSESSSLI